MDSGTVVQDHTGESKTLGPEIGRGGEGTVFQLLEGPFIVKIFHEKILEERGAELEKKIRFLADKLVKLIEKNLPRNRRYLLAELDRMCIPVCPVYVDGECVGYATQLAVGKSLSHLHPSLIKSDLPWYDRAMATKTALSLVRFVRLLHFANVIFGDVNKGMAILDTDAQDGSVWGVDMDTVSFSYGGHLFPCRGFCPDFSAPEVINSTDCSTAFSKESDAFAVYVLVFMLLNGGRHPFDQISEQGSVVDHIKAGEFPYLPPSEGGDQSRIPQGPWFRFWSHLSFRLKGLFSSMFSVNINNSGGRPTLDDLEDALEKYLYGIENQMFTNDLFPDQHKRAGQTQ